MDKIEQSLEEVHSIVMYVSKVSKEIVKEIRDSGQFSKPFEFTINSDLKNKFELYIKGNKITGSDYELNTWKSVPVVKIEIHRNSDLHPSKANEYWVAFSSIGSGWGGDNSMNLNYMENGHMKHNIEHSIKTAIEDFTEQNTL